MAKVTIVNMSQLGTNCWRAVRHTGGECSRLQEGKGKKTCNYPERKTCKAYNDQTRVVKVKERHHADGRTENI